MDIYLCIKYIWDFYGCKWRNKIDSAFGKLFSENVSIDEEIKDEEIKDEEIRDEKIRDEKIRDEKIRDEKIRDEKIIDKRL